MAPDEAIIALVAGDEAEQDEARGVLLDEYFGRLLAVLQRTLNLPEDVVDMGASAAFMELFDEFPNLVERGWDTPERIWKLLVTRGSSRVIDELRRSARLRGLPEERQKETAILELEDGTTPIADDLDVLADLSGQELTKSVLDYAATLEQPDRGVLLGMLIAKEVVDPVEAAAVDSVIIDCLEAWGDYSVEALRMRRKRVRKDLQIKFKELRR